MIRVKETSLKSIKKHYGSVDTYFVSKYGFSPYRGCQHGCAYCDGRAEKYFVEGVFDEDIEIRTNVVELLDQSLFKIREHGIVGVGSGVSDAYQPIEEKYAIMPQIIDVLIRHEMSAYVMTKSALVLRDLDKWKLLNEKSGVTLYVSLTTADDGIGAYFEPGASSPSERLEIIRAFKAAGIGVVVLAMPLMPYITDTASNVRHLFRLLSEMEVDAVIPAGMTLRPGRQKDYFLSKLKGYDSHLLSKYAYLYGENKPSGAPRTTYVKEMNANVNRMRRQSGIDGYVPHKLYAGRLQLYDEIYVLLSHMLHLYNERNVEVKPLVEAFRAYRTWYDDEKAQFAKVRSLSGNDLDSKLIFMLETGVFKELIDNDKLYAFLSQVMRERKIFSYKRMRLE